MAIYKDKDSDIPVTSIAAFLSSPLCTAATIPQELLESLQQVLYYIDGNSSTTPPSSLDFPTTPPAVLTSLYTNGFAPGGISVSGTSGSYALNVTDPDKILAGPLCSALYMVVLFHLTKQLQTIAAGTISTRSDTSPDAGVIAANAIIPDSSQPPIYQVLKQVLIDNGFKLPKSTADKIEFNKLLMPNRPLGGKAVVTQNTSIKGVLMRYMVKNYEGAPGGYNPLPDDDHFMFKDPNVMTVYKQKVDAGVSPNDRIVYLQNAYNYVLLNIFQQWNIQKDQIIQQLVKCLFNAITPGKELPDGMTMASGDGSDTNGVLNISRYGILLLEYDYTYEPLSTDSKKSTTVVKNQKTRSFNAPSAGSSTTVHVDVLGLNSTAPTIGVSVGTYGCFFTAPVSGAVPVPTDPGSTYDTMKAAFPFPPASFVPQNPSDPNNKIFFFTDKPTPPYTVLATYNKATQDLTFISDGGKVMISEYAGAEEVITTATVVKSLGKKFDFSVEALFGDDRFELTTNQKDTAFLQPASSYNSYLDEIVTLLNTSSLTLTPTIVLNGAFVGMLSTNSTSKSKVTKDPAYSLFRGSTDKIEDYLPPATGSTNETLYPQLRYSFGTVTYQPGFLQINITSYVSPLRSRLDKRLLGPNLDGTGTPTDPNNPFDYRSYSTFNLPRYNSDLQPNTWYGANPSTNAYLLLNESLPYNSSTNPKLASYNQLLSALRCFGILEALIYRINQRAALQSSTVQANVAANLTTILGMAQAGTIATGGIPANPLLRINNTNYQNLKWYTSAADQALY